MIYNAHPYQVKATDFIKDHSHCALFMEMGLGKTVATLTAIDSLMYDRADVGKVLVVAPKSVALNTWSGESAKWEHLNHLRLSIVMGLASERRAALDADADIYVTNRDNVVWLVNEYAGKNLDWPFDMVVLDESSSFKNFQSKRWKALWKMWPQISRLVELTGTPAPNGLMDLWAQVKLLDGGERLGKFIGQYRDKYFTAGARSGAVVYDWRPRPGSKEKISDIISDICLSMKAKDYLSLPDIVEGGMEIQLPELKAYQKFEKECVMSAGDGEEILATTAVALTNKLLQFSSGAIYDDEHTWHQVSSAKQEALADLLEQTSDNVLLFYNYQHEKDRILSDHPEAVTFRGEPEILTQWNEGKIKLLLCHPASVAYGLNMQAGGHVIVWYSPTWNLELYEQANARLHRQGQSKMVVRYHLICTDTMDEVVMNALRSKSDTQEALMTYLKQLKTI